MSIVLLLILAIFLNPISGNAQDNISFEYIDSSLGLSNLWVATVSQDKFGFLWFGTQFGLNRFDGYSMKTYLNQPGDPNSFSGDSIVSSFVDSDGNLWIGTISGGINKYEYATDNFTSYTHDPVDPKSISDNFVSAICQDQKGRHWFGTAYGGLNLMEEEGVFRSFVHKENDRSSISNNSITSIIALNDGKLLVGTRHGLNYYNIEKAVFSSDVGDAEFLKTASIKLLFQDSSGKVWISTENSGIHILSRDGKVQPLVVSAIAAQAIKRTFLNDILEDSEGNFWLATAQYGVLKYFPEKNTWLSIQNNAESPARLPHNSVRSIIEDRQGIIWITTEQGIVKHNKLRDRFRVYLNDRAGNSSLTGIKVFAIHAMDENNVWVGSGQGGVTQLNLITDERKRVEANSQHKEALLSNTIRSICHDDAGNMWFGTESNGLFLYNPNSTDIKHFRFSEDDPNGIQDNFVRFVTKDKNGRVWVGTEKGGLNLYIPQSKNFKSYKFTGDTQGPASDRIFFMFEDKEKDGKFWLGTDKGINVFDYELSEFTVPSGAKNFSGSISSGLTICGYGANNGDLWFGSISGMFVFKQKSNSFRHLTTRDGLPDNLVYAITEDSDGNIWASSNNGIVQIDPETYKVEVISVFKAPLTNEYNVGAICRMPSGELLFGAMHGLVRFMPGHQTEHNYNPPVYLTSFKKFEEKVATPESIMEVKSFELLPKDHFVTFEFTSLDFDDSKQNKYRYKLIGLEDEWINLRNRRYVSFSSLPPQNYKLIVQGSNSYGMWSNNQVEIDLIVLPELWETWWFRIAAAMLLVVGALGFYTMRTRSVRKQRDLLRKEVALHTGQLTNQNERLNEQKALLEENSKVLEQTNKELESFTYTVSHDLRAPLRHIAGYNDLIRSEYGEQLDENAAVYFSRISSSVNRMNELIENFLRFATSTKQDVIRTEVNLSRIARDTLKFIQEADPTNSVEIVIEENLLDLCDLKLVKVVMENLLSNAWKYSRNIDKPRIEFGLKERDGRKAYFVSDNGVGFDSEKATELFKPFHRLHSEREFNGLGIGLATVQRIIHRHNGNVWAESKEGEGAVFYFTLE